MAHLEELTYSRFPRLGERRKQLAGTLPGGEQQTLAQPRAFSIDPELVMLDELSTRLALIVVRQLYELVTGAGHAGLSILVVEQFARSVLPSADSVLRHALGPDCAGGVCQPISKTISCPATWVPERLLAPGSSSPPQSAAAASRSHAVPSKNRGFAPAWSRTGLVKVNCSNSSGVTDPRSSSS